MAAPEPVPPPDPALLPDLAAARAEAARLRAQAKADAEAAARAQVRRETRRNRFAVLLAVIGTALLATAALTAWLVGVVLAPQGFAKTIAAAADDPRVEQAASDQLLDALRPVYGELASRTLVTPPAGADGRRPAARPVDTVAFEAALQQAVDGSVASPVFVGSWVEGQTRTHDAVLALVDGAPPTPAQAEGTSVSVPLQPTAQEVQRRLAAEGFAFVSTVPPPPIGDLVISTTASVVPYASFLDTVRSLRWLVPLLALVAVGAAYALSTRRVRLTLLLGVDLVLAMGAVVLLSSLMANVAGDRGITPDDPALLAAMYQPFGELLRRSGLVGATVGAVLAAIAIGVITVRAVQARRVRSRRRREAAMAARAATEASG